MIEIVPNEFEPRRIAMWSGPRNISTALMRAWSNRADTFVVDEPFYAFYLQRTGKPHPGAAEVIAQGQPDWRAVVEALLHPVSATKPERSIFYQKQMTHHLLPEIDRRWLGSVTNCFLIRDPREVILSYLKRNGVPTAEDLGFPQQADIFDWVREQSGATPPVIDARDVLQDPERVLRLLCKAVGLEFDEAMLSWPPGLRETDGIWAKDWYGAVAKSTSFQPYQPKNESVPERLREVHKRALQCYERLYEHRLR
jgi:hypothetical protein